MDVLILNRSSSSSSSYYYYYYYFFYVFFYCHKQQSMQSETLNCSYETFCCRSVFLICLVRSTLSEK